MMKHRVVLAIWALAVVTGFTILVGYSMKSAATLDAHQAWPADITWARANKPTLVVFLHPKCGCSRATLAELETLLPKLNDSTQIILDFYYPASQGEDFAKGRLFEMTKRFPGVEVKFDQDAANAEKFLARASGETFYFAQDGALKFHGGLTPLRGHSGDNIGRRAIAALAEGKEPETNSSRVFGCQLKEELANEVALAQ